MNIETIAENIALFRNLVIESGFKRDLRDYLDSLPNNQGNIIVLREVAGTLRNSLEKLYLSDLPDALKQLLVTKKVRPFTEKPFLANIEALLADKAIPQDKFFARLYEIVQSLHTELEGNEQELVKIEGFIKPFISSQIEKHTSEKKATISIILKEKMATTNLKEFTKTLGNWNRVLPLYHQLLKSESPEDIELVTVENGSIDFIVNVDVDVAVNLVELFKVGFKCYIAYLTYKQMIKPITDSYFGNPALIKSEDERERELLKNIGMAIEHAIREQHKNAKSLYGLSPDNPDKVIEQVKSLVSSHVVKGNDIKLLGMPAASDDKSSEEKTKNELREVSNAARNARKALPIEQAQKLLDLYGEIKD